MAGDFAELKYAESLAGRAGEGEMSDFENEGDRGIAATDRTAIVHASFITYMHLDYRDIATVPSAHVQLRAGYR